ncbi:MAG: RNA 2',3'-cyclic phosphodiesterase [Candidatus Eiseniibacteriota bacterium]
MTRTFVALLIPVEWKEYLGACARSLAEGTSGLSWVKPENFHLTIRFLGDLGDSGVQRVSEWVAASADGLEAPLGRLGPVGAFPNLDRPRAIWVGLAEGAEAFAEVARSVNDALKRKGFGPPDKPSRAHITLARVRDGAKGLERIARAALPPPPAAAFLDRICVMKSELHPAGSRYTALQECQLRTPGGAPPPRP